jgi:hypothetical protein
VLIREGFSWGALVFGPLWLFAHRAWIPGVLVLFLDMAIGALTTGILRAALSLAMAWLLGLVGQDLRRWSLERRGYLMPHIVAATDEDAAMARLLQRRPDLIAEALR